MTNFISRTSNNVGTVAAQPVSGSVSTTVEQHGSFFRIDIKLAAAQIPVTDAGASGSYGALKLMDLNEGVYAFLASRSDYTAFAEGAALTGAAGDAVFDIGVGSVAIAAAADGALAGTDDDIVPEIAVTLSGGTGTGSANVVTAAVVDGSAAAKDLVLNWSGTAATIDANSTIDVTGTISIVGVFLNDD